MKSNAKVVLATGGCAFLAGGMIGILLALGIRTDSSVNKSVETRPKPQQLETGIDPDLAIRAIEGNLNAAEKLFNICTYQLRDYQRSYYWAALCEELGYDTKFGSLVETAAGNILAELTAERDRKHRENSNEEAPLRDDLPVK